MTERDPPTEEVAKTSDASPSSHRIQLRHGPQAGRIASRMAEDPRTRDVVCLCQHVVRAEIDQSIADGAESLETISEKTGLGVGACGGVRCTFACARMIEESRPDVPARELVRRFHASPRVLRAALKVDGDEAAKNLLAQIERLRAVRASQK